MKNITLLLIALCLVVGAGCKKKKDPDPEPIPYTTFKVNGTAKNWKTCSNFSKDFCSSSTFCCRFSPDTSATSPTLKLGIPGDPIVGHVYTSGEYRFSCFYVDEAGTRYDISAGDPFTLQFTEWQGQGGWGKGIFSGYMRSATLDTVVFQNGYFQNKIWTIGSGK